MKDADQLIPATWTLTVNREAGSWCGLAHKQEGARRIEVSTYDEPQPTFGAMVQLLYERIKS